MALSKSSNAYNRQNWEDAVCMSAVWFRVKYRTLYGRSPVSAPALYGYG